MAINLLDIAADLATAEQAAKEFEDKFIADIKAAADGGAEAFKQYKGAVEEELRQLAKAAQKENEKAAKGAADAAAHQQKEYEKIATESWEAIGKAAKEAYDKEQKEADEAAKAGARAFEEIGKAAQAHLNKLQKWGQTASEVRGIVGDVGDAVGALGKGLFGFSEDTQLAADKLIYMGEKGMALGQSIGGLFGPLGAVAGSVVGGLGGGLMGLLAANAEIAAKEMLKQVNVALKAEQANRDLAKVIKDLNKELGTIDTSNLQGAIQAYDAIGSELSNAKEELTKLNVKIDENRRRSSAAIEETEKEKQERAELIDAIMFQDKKVSELTKKQELAAIALKTQAGQEAKSVASQVAQLKDKSKAQLEADVASKKAAFEIAKLTGSIKAEALATQDNADKKAKLAKEIKKNSDEVRAAKAEYEAAEKALKTFGENGAKAAAKVTKETEKENNELEKLAETLERQANESWLNYNHKLFNDRQQAEIDLANLKKKLDEDALTRAIANLQIVTAKSIEEMGREQKTMEFFANQNAEREKQQAKEKSLFDPEEFNRIDAFLKKMADAGKVSLDAALVIKGALHDIGNMAKDAIAGLAVDSFNNWLEAVATGEKDAEKSFKKIAAAAIRNIGSQLVADGVKNILQGTANVITGQPKGAALIGVGTAEVAAGIGMGATGARAQRRQGYGDDRGGSLGRNSGATKEGPVVQAPTIIQINSLTPGDKRAWQEAGRVITQAQNEFKRG